MLVYLAGMCIADKARKCGKMDICMNIVTMTIPRIALVIHLS